MLQELNELHFEDFSNAAHPSIFVLEEAYALFILRLPRLVKQELRVESVRFVISGEKAFRFDDATLGAQELERGMVSVYGIIDRLVDGMMQSVDAYLEDVNDLEEELLERRKGVDFMARWFYLKKDMNRIERLCIPALLALERLIDAKKEAKGFPAVGFHDVKEHMERTHRLVQHNLKKLDEAYAFYGSWVNEKMNRTIYLLAIVSAIFLPLNFIVGFFGINTGGLFFADDPAGTLRVVGIIIGITLVLTLLMFIFRKKVFQ